MDGDGCLEREKGGMEGWVERCLNDERVGESETKVGG